VGVLAGDWQLTWLWFHVCVCNFARKKKKGKKKGGGEKERRKGEEGERKVERKARGEQLCVSAASLSPSMASDRSVGPSIIVYHLGNLSPHTKGKKEKERKKVKEKKKEKKGETEQLGARKSARSNRPLSCVSGSASPAAPAPVFACASASSQEEKKGGREKEKKKRGAGGMESRAS